ncbi:MAG: hypothetical protein ACI4L2_07585 [Wujia sp.]
MHKKSFVLVMVMALALLSGCKKEDKLVLVTTEAQTATDAVSEDTTEDILADIREEAESTTEAAPVREEASEEDKKVTLEDIYNANKGDTLLADGQNYSLNTIYYYNGVEQYSEYQFLGFAEDGTYLQAYEDSEGLVQVLDKEHGYWFLIDENIVYALIYPEPSVADAIINANHNDMIISLTEADQTIRDIYREDGDLVVETDYKNNDEYVFKYILDDTYKVLEYYCYDKAGEKLSFSWVTKGGEYEFADEISSARESMMSRNVTFKFPESNGLENTYIVPIDKPVQLALLEYGAYSDEACTTVWEETPADSNGFYADEVIYLKRSVDSQDE